MTPFENYKKEILHLAKAQKKEHLIPDPDVLYSEWLKGSSPAEVVATCCRWLTEDPSSQERNQT